MPTDERQKQTPIWPWVLIGVIPLLYWFSIGPFIHWKTSARTRRQYHTRQKVVQRFYAPMIWLEIQDPTGAIRKFDLWIATPWVKPGFNWAALPEK